MPTKPLHLQHGDTIGVVAPASPPPDPSTIERVVAALEKLGFKARLGAQVRRRHGFLAGSDRERAEDLMEMFTEPRVKGIVCLRGGYGTTRLLSLLDFSTIRANPKVFVGYSDITALHLAFLKKASLVSFHGPMVHSDFIKPELPEFTLQGFLRTVMQPSAPGSICRGYDGQTVQVISPGTAAGPLVGGNLSLICATLGTCYQPAFKGRIFFFEDIEEAPYRIDRMLTHLLNAGVLQQVAGIAVGIHRNCIDPKAKEAKEYRQTLEDVLQERLAPLKVPVVSGLPFGHVPLNATLALGVRARLDAGRGELCLEEPAVK